MGENVKMQIVIIGGSVGGLTAAKRARRINELAEITIIEESKYINFPISALLSYASSNIKKLETIYNKNEENSFDIGGSRFNNNLYWLH